MKKIRIFLLLLFVLLSIISCDFYSLIFGAENVALSIEKIIFYEKENKELNFDVMGSLEGQNWYIHIPPTINPDTKLIPQFEGKYDELLLNGVTYNKGEKMEIKNSFSISIKKNENIKFYTLIFVNDTLLIKSFKIEASKNTVLIKDIIGYINDNTINIPLPYNIARDRIKLIPTIEISPGNTIAPDVTIPQDFFSGVKYFLSGPNISIAKEYNIVSSVDTDSMTFLRVDDPFYVLDAIEYPIDVYEIEYLEENISLKIPTTLFYKIQNNRIGFNQIEYPFNVEIDKNLFYGSFSPFTVPVISKNGLYRANYNIELSREIVSGTGIDVKLVVQEIYRYEVNYYHNIDEYKSWLDQKCTNWGASMHGSYFSQNKMQTIQSFGSAIRHKHYFSDKPPQYTFDSSCSGRLAQNQTYNNQILNYSIPVTIGYIYSDSFTIDANKSYKNTVEYEAPDQEVINESDVVRNFVMTICNCTSERSPSSVSLSDTFTWKKWKTKIYNNLNYYKINEVIVTGPEFCTFENITAFEKVESYSVNDNVIKFIPIDCGKEKLKGAIAFINVISESGNKESHVIVLE